jgi:hypothetical protein
MTPEELRALLSHGEDIKLDFKREYKLSKNAPPGCNRQRWAEFVNGQWDEFIKDIIALANGNVGAADRAAHLVIGADDCLLPDGTRQLYDMADWQVTEQQALARVNSTCQPPLPQLLIERVVVDDKTIVVVTVPPSPYLHETTRQLATKKGSFDSAGCLQFVTEDKTYSEYTAFIRKGESTAPASWVERRELERDKRFEVVALNEAVKAEIVDNLREMLRKVNGSFADPARAIESIKTQYSLEFDDTIEVDRDYLNRVTLLFWDADASYQYLSTQSLDNAIQSGRYRQFDRATGTYRETLLLQYLRSLHAAIDRFKILAAMYSSQGSEFTAQYCPKNRPGSTVRIPCNKLIPIMTVIYRYGDVVSLSAALLKYLADPSRGLDEVRLNPPTAASSEVEALAQERLSSQEIVDWALNRSLLL